MNNKLIKNYALNLIYQLFVMFVPLITAPYLARTLGAEAMGTYSYIYSFTSIICTVVLLGIYNYGNRQIAYVRDDKEKLSNTFWQIMSTRLVIALLGTIIYAVCVAINGRYTVLFTIYYSYLLAYFLDCTWLYVGVEDMKWAVIKNAVTKVICVVGIFLLVKEPDDLYIYVSVQGLSVLISNLLAYSQLNKYVHKPHIDFSNVKKDLSASAALFLPSLATTVYLQCDKVMIELITGNTSEVSFYDYSEKIVTIPLTFITVLSTVMMPRLANEFAKDHKDKISSLVNRAINFSLFLAFPMCFGLMSVADKLIPWYLGDEFLPTINAIVIISPIIIANALTAISGTQYFTATNQISIMLKSQVPTAIGNIIINAILIPKYGFIGAAVATLICSYTSAIIQYIYLSKQVRLSGIIKNGLKYFAFSAIMAMVIRIITNGMSATPLVNIIQVLIGVAVYITLCAISRDEQLKEGISILFNIVKRRGRNDD
ncbi:MAG: flippase [Oscillospiraceae bacterium]|nr:flippase [Oscillospiraceae bacterium]